MRLSERNERGAFAWYSVHKDEDSEQNGFAWYCVLRAPRGL
jgi:hypothetical protein